MSKVVTPFVFGYPQPDAFTSPHIVHRLLDEYTTTDQQPLLASYCVQRSKLTSVIPYAHTPKRWGNTNISNHDTVRDVTNQLTITWFSVYNRLKFTTPRTFAFSNEITYTWSSCANLSKFCGYKKCHARSFSSPDPQFETIMILWLQVTAYLNAYHLIIQKTQNSTAVASEIYDQHTLSKKYLEAAIGRLSMIETEIKTWARCVIPNYRTQNAPAELDSHVVMCMRYYICCLLNNADAAQFMSIHMEQVHQEYDMFLIPVGLDGFVGGCQILCTLNRAMHSLSTRGLMYCHRAVSTQPTTWSENTKPFGCAKAYVRHLLAYMRVISLIRTWILKLMAIICNNASTDRDHACYLFSLIKYAHETLRLLHKEPHIAPFKNFRPVDDFLVINQYIVGIESNLKLFLDKDERDTDNAYEATQHLGELNATIIARPNRSALDLKTIVETSNALYCVDLMNKSS